MDEVWGAIRLSRLTDESTSPERQREQITIRAKLRPERQDPPDRLLRTAAEAGCLFTIDTDAHAPGQLDWIGSGCARAESFGIERYRVINARGAEELRDSP